MNKSSTEVAKAAIKLAVSTREEEKSIIEEHANKKNRPLRLDSA